MNILDIYLPYTHSEQPDPATFMEIPAPFICMKIISNSWSNSLMLMSRTLNWLLNDSRIIFNIFPGILPMDMHQYSQKIWSWNGRKWLSTLKILNVLELWLIIFTLFSRTKSKPELRWIFKIFRRNSWPNKPLFPGFVYLVPSHAVAVEKSHFFVLLAAHVVQALVGFNVPDLEKEKRGNIP